MQVRRNKARRQADEHDLEPHVRPAVNWPTRRRGGHETRLRAGPQVGLDLGELLVVVVVVDVELLPHRVVVAVGVALLQGIAVFLRVRDVGVGQAGEVGEAVGGFGADDAVVQGPVIAAQGGEGRVGEGDDVEDLEAGEGGWDAFPELVVAGPEGDEQEDGAHVQFEVFDVGE